MGGNDVNMREAFYEDANTREPKRKQEKKKYESRHMQYSRTHIFTS